jgi:putative membrane protein
MHALQHASFLGTALLFWWALVHGREGRMGYGASVFYLFATAMHSGGLGALLTFAPAPWYGDYAGTTVAWGLTPLEDQQLAGLIMWIPAGAAYVVAGLILLAAWMREAERRAARWQERALLRPT